MPVAAPAAMLIGGAIGGGASIASGVLASKANTHATDASLASNAAALAFEREQAAQDQKNFELTQEQNKRQYDMALLLDQQRWNEDQRQQQFQNQQQVDTYNQRRALRQPYVDVGTSSVQALGKMAGLTVTPSAPPQLGNAPGAAQALSLADLAKLVDAEKARQAAARTGAR